MAEVIGVVSGAITFATVVVQVGKSILTFKSCWDQMQDAPEDIRKLVQEIELFGRILADIKDDLSQDSIHSALESNKHAIQSFVLCKEAADDLDAICKDLSRDVQPSSRMRRSYKALKIVMRKGNIEKHRSRLQNVIQLLMLSQQCYTRALVQLQPLLIAERIVQGSKSRSSPACSTTTVTTKANMPNILKGNRNDIYCWRLGLPSWMTSRVLEIAGMKAPTGWTWMLRTHNLTSIDSKTVQLVRVGDVKGLQALFSSRQASPFDQVAGACWRKSLLFHIGGINTTEMVEFLLEQGADPQGMPELPGYTALTYITTSIPYHYPENLQSLVPVLRSLLRHLDFTEDLTEETVICFFHNFGGSAEDFLFLQQNCCPLFYKLPLSIRINVAVCVANTIYFNAHILELLRTIIGKDILETDDFQSECYSILIEAETTLVHLAANAMGILQNHKRIWLVPFFDHHLEISKLLCNSWGSLVKQSVYAHADISNFVNGLTPFLAFCWGYFSSGSVLQPQGLGFDSAMKIWLETLQAGGVDLELYGRTEERVWKTEMVRREFGEFAPFSRRFDEADVARLIGFSYGPSSEDWHLWVSEPSDSLVGEFWNLVERPVEVMPGAWPRDDSVY